LRLVWGEDQVAALKQFKPFVSSLQVPVLSNTR
jgi:hypothetical protein